MTCEIPIACLQFTLVVQPSMILSAMANHRLRYRLLNSLGKYLNSNCAKFLFYTCNKVNSRRTSSKSCIELWIKLQVFQQVFPLSKDKVVQWQGKQESTIPKRTHAVPNLFVRHWQQIMHPKSFCQNKHQSRWSKLILSRKWNFVDYLDLLHLLKIRKCFCPWLHETVVVSKRLIVNSR
jgi:hypothetical protein